MAAPDQDSAQKVVDLLAHQPAEQKYAALKRRLLDIFDLSNDKRAAGLLNLRSLRDRKPTSLVDEMLSLIGDHRPCFLFNYLFLQSLPDDIRIALSGQQQQEPCQLGLQIHCSLLALNTLPYIELTGIVGKKRKSMRIDLVKKWNVLLSLTF